MYNRDPEMALTQVFLLCAYLYAASFIFADWAFGKWP